MYPHFYIQQRIRLHHNIYQLGMEHTVSERHRPVLFTPRKKTEDIENILHYSRAGRRALSNLFSNSMPIQSPSKILYLATLNKYTGQQWHSLVLSYMTVSEQGLSDPGVCLVAARAMPRLHTKPTSSDNGPASNGQPIFYDANFVCVLKI